jgi:hypothetical protein
MLMLAYKNSKNYYLKKLASFSKLLYMIVTVKHHKADDADILHWNNVCNISHGSSLSITLETEPLQNSASFNIMNSASRVVKSNVQRAPQPK